MMERDIQLDSYRALAMMYIVCLIHPVLWYHIHIDGFDPTMLFQMPVIFYIAGASQTCTRRRTLSETIKNRALRVLLPYYIYIFVVLLLMGMATFMQLPFEHSTLDIRQLGTTGIIKLLLTGGSTHIPYMGYTWFISTYFIIACSLPLQQRIMRHISGKYYLLIAIGSFGAWKATGLTSPENIVENVLGFNIFYLLGYLTYKQTKTTYWGLALSAAVLLGLLVSGAAIPMANHKFPSDMVFIAYHMCTLYMLAWLMSHIRIRPGALINLWNRRGYTIYLYQSVSHYLVYGLMQVWFPGIGSQPLLFILSALLAFASATALSCITYPWQQYIVKQLHPKHPER